MISDIRTIFINSLTVYAIQLLLVTSAKAVDAPCNSEKSFISPYGEYEAISTDILLNGECNGKFSITTNKSNKEKKYILLSSVIDVAWSPNSKEVALNERVGSNYGECHIITLSLDHTIPGNVIRGAIAPLMQDGGEVLHSYCAFEKWTSTDTLLTHLWGDNDTKFWDVVGVYHLNGSFDTLSQNSRPR